jgi:transposase
LTEQVKKHLKRGRPTKEPQVVGYRIKTSIKENKSTIEEELSSKGRFILATNQLNEEQLNDDKILSEYKNQNQTEQGFRFLKDPWFMADSFFLKTPSRIEALMFVMTLCLMVYNVGQFWLRKKLNILTMF